MVAGFLPLKWVIGFFFNWDIFSFSTTAPKWSNAKNLIFVNYRRSVEHSENANLKVRKSRLNQSSQTRLSLPHRVFQTKTSLFMNPRHGMPVFQSIKSNPTRADISAEVNKEADVLAVGRSSTGGINVPSIQNPSSRNQKQTDMIKDEYFNINDCNNQI